jgi:hypothetical protein
VEGEGMKIDFKNYRSTWLIVIIGGLWILFSMILEEAWEVGIFYGLGPAAVIGVIFYCYDKWCWKWPVFKWLNKVPNLNGHYSGKITFNYDGEDREKECSLMIKQTCSQIKVTSIFNKDDENSTRSNSIEAFITQDEIGDKKLYFYYQNSGSCVNGDTLDQHDGVNVLDINFEKRKVVSLDGYYFTNRNPQTKGCMEVFKVNKEK